LGHGRRDDHDDGRQQICCRPNSAFLLLILDIMRDFGLQPRAICPIFLRKRSMPAQQARVGKDFQNHYFDGTLFANDAK
jgi:hypothetical protein